MRVGLIANNIQWRGPDTPHKAVQAGLESLGYTVDVANVGKWPIFSNKPDVVFVWNGAKHGWVESVDACRDAGIPVLIMERGFFDRMRYTQIDHAGFNHTASWVERFREPAPSKGAARLAEVWPAGMFPYKPRAGHILVLGQTPGDAQLADSEIGTDGLLGLVENSLNDYAATIRFRPHPNVRKSETSLAEDIGRAEFCVTINSNAGNEALAGGCPVLCLGPALYAIAGMAKQTTAADMPNTIESLLHGWHPRDADVLNYLQWLACRQWNNAELAEGSVLKKLIEGAMENVL